MKNQLRSMLLSTLLLGTSLLAVDAKSELDKTNKDTVNSIETQKELDKLAIKEYDAKAINAFARFNRVDPKLVKLVSADFYQDLGFTRYLFTVDGFEIKGLLFETDKGLYLPTDFFNQDGINIYKEEFYQHNKDFIDNQNKIQEDKKKAEKDAMIKEMEENAPKVISYITDLENGKYGDLIRSIPGNSSKTETLYLFTDPLCPFCIMYETGVDPRTKTVIPNYGIKHDLQNYKEIKVIMYPLYTLQGHETSIKRAFWFNEESKKVKTQAELLNLLSKASSAPISEIIVDEEKFKPYNAFVRNTESGLLTNNVIQGTPAIYNSKGLDPRLLKD